MVAVNQVMVPDNQADRPSAYYEAVKPLEDLETELDLFEGALEAAYRAGGLSQADFWELERAVEDFEYQLDKAEDNLEQRMRVDD